MKFYSIILVTLLFVACSKISNDADNGMANDFAKPGYSGAFGSSGMPDSAIIPSSYIYFDAPRNQSSQKTDPAGLSYLFFINTAASKNIFSYFINNYTINNTNYGYLDITQYYALLPGKYPVTVKSGNTVLDNKEINFEKSKSYTLFIADTGIKTNLIAIQDITKTPKKDSANIRFANMSPDVDFVDFYDSKGNILASKIKYKEATKFVTVKAENNLSFLVTESGTKNILSKSELVSFFPLHYYTLLTSGFSSKTSPLEKLRLETVQHF